MHLEKIAATSNTNLDRELQFSADLLVACSPGTSRYVSRYTKLVKKKNEHVRENLLTGEPMKKRYDKCLYKVFEEGFLVWFHNGGKENLPSNRYRHDKLQAIKRFPKRCQVPIAELAKT